MNTINITVKTQSGSTYTLQHKGDKLYIQKGLSLSGEVVKLYENIRVGGVLHVDFIREGLYGAPDSSPMFLRTSTITDIVIR